MMDPRPERAAGAPPGRWHDLGVRTLSGLALVAVALASAHFGGAVFAAVWLVAAVIVQWEWQGMIAGRLFAGRLAAGVAATCLVALLHGRPIAAVLAMGLGAACAGALAGPRRRLWAVGGVVYGGLFLLALLDLRASPDFGARSVFWLFATVWSVDVFAYGGGRLIGGPKLWPRVSPSKTWSGTLCGVLAGGVVGTTVALDGAPAEASLAPVLALTLATAVLSQVGDGLESAMKRCFEVKDSGRIIPGHGGVMDRLDGFSASAIFAFLFGLARGMPPAAGLFHWR